MFDTDIVMCTRCNINPFIMLSALTLFCSFDAQATKTQLSLLGTVAAPSLPKHHHPLEHTLPHHTHSHPQDEAIGELTERARNGQVKPPSL